jgi:hypothetical protein
MMNMPSSYAVSDERARARVQGLVRDEEARGGNLEAVFDLLLAFPGVRRPRKLGESRFARVVFFLYQVAIFAGILFKWNVLSSVPPLLCHTMAGYTLARYDCAETQSLLLAANLTPASPLDVQIRAISFDSRMPSHDVSHWWQSVLNEKDRNSYRIQFLGYRANTLTTGLTIALANLSVAMLFPAICVALCNSNEALFPACLVRNDEDGSMQFVRLRRFAMQVAMFLGSPLSIILTLIFYGWQKWWVYPVFWGISVAVAPMLVGAVLIQRCNVGMLAQSLAACKTSAEVAQWKARWYKPSIFMLRSWSRRVSVVVVAVFILLWTNTLNPLLAAFVMHAQMEMQEEEVSSAVRNLYAQTVVIQGVSAAKNAIVLVGLVLGLSVTSRQYSGLNLVMASLNLPGTESGLSKEFAVLQKRYAAFAVYGVPLTPSRSKELVHFLLVSSVVSMWTLASAFPYTEYPAS